MRAAATAALSVFCALAGARLARAEEAVAKAPTPGEPKQLIRSPAAFPRTAIPELVSGDPRLQYFFLHDDNYFALQVNGGSPPRTKFQLSIRFEMVNLFDLNNIAFNFAYTQTSFWDALDFAHSSPFIESDYHPELFVSYRRHRDVRYREAQLGCQHESNGLGAVGNVDQTPDSRSWNSCFVQASWGFVRDPQHDPWLFPTVGARVWQSFWSDQPVTDAVGRFQVFIDVDLSIPNHLQLGRFSNRLTIREHSVQDNLLYAILPVATSGLVRTWVFAQIFYGEAERLITAGDKVTHIYVGIGFQ
ncbi:MAG TPA: phospholipase A [Polyangia bacterium]|nr:phospholipase A [Polyangia bacterium]